MTIVNALRSKTANVIPTVTPITHKFSDMVNELRLTRLSIMNPHENFCHVASIFRKDGKEQYFKLRYWL